MSVLDILTPELVADLPDDPQAAFAVIIRKAYGYLEDRLNKIDGDDQSSWYAYETAEHTVVNTIIASAKRYNIEPFSSMAVPTRKNFNDQVFVEFKVDLDHYVAQSILDSGIRAKRDIVEIPSKIRDRLRGHIHGIKKLIDEADIADGRRSILHKKIIEFELALDRDRINIFGIARILIEILSLTSNVVTLADSPTMARLTSNIMHAVAEAKATDSDQRPNLPADPPVLFLPARPAFRPITREEFSADLDDEIPF